MKALTATSPGHPGRSNEDFVAASPGVVVLLDGAGVPGTESICRHGVAWNAHTLGAALLASLTRGGGATDPVSALAEAIDQIAARHWHTCDIANPSSPQATVAIVTVEDGWLGYLVLADALVVLDPADATPVVITDPREVAVRDECTAPLHGLPVGTAEYDRGRHRKCFSSGPERCGPSQQRGQPDRGPVPPRRLVDRACTASDERSRRAAAEAPPSRGQSPGDWLAPGLPEARLRDDGLRRPVTWPIVVSS